MLSGCSSLININLSNFNTQKVLDMSWMFYECLSLISINLYNFNTQNAKDMAIIFYGCSSLKKGNIIAKDKKIFEQYLNAKI